MLPLELDRALFRLELNTPALAPLFQLPPRIRHHIRPAPCVGAKSAYSVSRLRGKLRSLPCASFPHKILRFCGDPEKGYLLRDFRYAPNRQPISLL